MSEEWYRIVDAEGRSGVCRSLQSDVSRIEVRLESGERFWMPQALVRAQEDGSFIFEHPFSSLLEHSSEGQVAVPVVQEELEVDKRTVGRERVRVRTTVSQREETVDLPLVQEDMTIERVPIGRAVERHEAPYRQGDTLVVPVYEEVLFVEKRLVLREEVRVRCVRREAHTPQRVTLRTMEAAIERAPIEDGTSSGPSRPTSTTTSSEAS
jgi:uncharacterized protein (TIGR02271 family)